MSQTPENEIGRVKAVVAGRVNTLLEARKASPEGVITSQAMDDLLKVLTDNPKAIDALFEMQGKNGVVGGNNQDQ